MTQDTVKYHIHITFYILWDLTFFSYWTKFPFYGSSWRASLCGETWNEEFHSQLYLGSDPLLDLQVSEGGFARLFWPSEGTAEVQGTLSGSDSHLYHAGLPPASQSEIEISIKYPPVTTRGWGRCRTCFWTIFPSDLWVRAEFWKFLIGLLSSLSSSDIWLSRALIRLLYLRQSESVWASPVQSRK